MENAYSACVGLNLEGTFPLTHADLGIPRVADFRF